MGLNYRAGKDTLTGQQALFAVQKGGLPFNSAPVFPVATLIAPTKGFPLSAQQVAENIADLLNHRAPLHRLSSGNEQIFYTRTDDAIILKTKGTGDGVSVPALSITVCSKSSVADVAQDVLALMDQDFMRRVCDTIVPDSEPAATAQQKGPKGPSAKF